MVKKSTSTVGYDPKKLEAVVPRKKGLPGRPLGRKNNKTLVKEAVISGLEQQMLECGEEVIGAIIKQALEGCRISQKMYLDRVMPAVKAQDANATSKSPSINITIGKAEDSIEVKRIQGEIIDAD